MISTVITGEEGRKGVEGVVECVPPLFHCTQYLFRCTLIEVLY